MWKSNLKWGRPLPGDRHSLLLTLASLESDCVLEPLPQCSSRESPLAPWEAWAGPGGKEVTACPRRGVPRAAWLRSNETQTKKENSGLVALSLVTVRTLLLEDNGPSNCSANKFMEWLLCIFLIQKDSRAWINYSKEIMGFSYIYYCGESWCNTGLARLAHTELWFWSLTVNG